MEESKIRVEIVSECDSNIKKYKKFFYFFSLILILIILFVFYFSNNGCNQEIAYKKLNNFLQSEPELFKEDNLSWTYRVCNNSKCVRYSIDKEECVILPFKDGIL